MKLTAQTDKGKIPDFAVPNIKITPFFEHKTGQLAVIFDIENSPIPHFYANTPTYNALTLTRILQEDFLWESNCYELFLAFSNKVDSPYLEINFAPTGEFNLYHFDGYRAPQQMPPRRLQVTEKQRRDLLNCYTVSQDWQAVFWQDSLPPQQAFRNVIESKFPLETDSHRLVMIVDMAILAKLLRVEVTDNIWLNPCAVFLNQQAKQEMAYFAYQHGNLPDFHDKKYWLRQPL